MTDDPNRPMSQNDARQLVYGAVTKSLENDTAASESVRTRATAVLTASGLMTAFLVGIGIKTHGSNANPFPGWAIILLGITLLVIASLTMMILWPMRNWGYGASAKIFQEKLANSTPDQATEDMVTEMIQGHVSNLNDLKTKFAMFRASVLAFACEIAILVVVLWQVR